MKKAETVCQVQMVRPFCLRLIGSDCLNVELDPEGSLEVCFDDALQQSDSVSGAGSAFWHGDIEADRPRAGREV
jgi:hypothetical protein